jgi:hypothetical protein
MEVLRGELPNKFLITAAVNGLIATSVIWIFWTPFLFFIAAPLMNAIIKNQLCAGTGQLALLLRASKQGNNIVFKPFEAYADNLASPAITGQNLVLEDKQFYNEENLQIFLLFGLVSLIVVSSTLFFARYLIIKNRLDMRGIVIFNIIMAVIIMLIEMLFFASVTTKYVPFNIQELASKLGEKINDALMPLTSPLPNYPNNASNLVPIKPA